jgi:hypothetical protein
VNTSIFLQQNEAAVLRGGFAILFRHGRWHLVGTREDDGRRNIISVHVMSPERAAKVLDETPNAEPKSYAELGSNFSEEVASKVLPTAADYLPLFRAHEASLAAGLHTDTMQQAEYTDAKERAFLDVLSKMMSKGEPGACLYFTGCAL